MREIVRVNNKDIPERRHWRRSCVFIVNFEYISHLFSVSIVDFEQVNVCWVGAPQKTFTDKFSQIPRNTLDVVCTSF